MTSDRASGAIGVAAGVTFSVAAAIGVSYVLPSAQAFGAGMPESMVGGVIAWTAILTGALAILTGACWYVIAGAAWGRAMVSAMAITGVGFILLMSWSNCLIPHEYCSAIP